MKKNYRLLLIVISLFLSRTSVAQQYMSVAQEETIRQQAMSSFPVDKWDSLRCAWYGECAQTNTGVTARLNEAACPLSKRMFGWHFLGTSSASYVWQSLTDLSYFSYQVDYLTGNAVNATQLVNWGNNATVLAAKTNGVNVNLTVTFFGTATTFGSFFANPTAQQTLITNLVNHVVTADVKGLNIDFEGGAITSATVLPAYLSFLADLRTQLLAAKPGSEISVDIQGSHAANSAYITGLNNVVDLLILMGYDYYWAQNYPGPIAPTWVFPKAPSDPNGHGSVATDLNSMLRFAPKEKILLAVPYYGRIWNTTNGCVLPADGNAAPATLTYANYRNNASGYYTNTLRDPHAHTAYNCFVNVVDKQSFIDDVYSMQTKYDLIHQRGLAGGAMWRLGYDAGYSDLWDLINNNLSDCAAMPCRDTLYDMGGPLLNYVSRSNYYFTINPPGANALSLRFLSFDFEAGFDSLWVFNGPDTLSPRIGAFSGAVLPPTVVATSGIMTIKVFTDNLTVRSGFAAIYNCSPQLVRTVSSGNWNDPQVWETGAVPLASDSALIMPTHNIVVTGTHAIAKVDVSPTATVSMADASAILNIGN